MAVELNATCAICGKRYHVCNSCGEVKSFTPWRSIVDTLEHYQIYFALHDYTLNKNKEKAREELSKCDLTGFENFPVHIKEAINEIMETPKEQVKKEQKTSKKTNSKLKNQG